MVMVSLATGSGFSDGPTAVLFGSEAAAAEINFVSDKGDVIVCLTPHCPPGKVWIEVRVIFLLLWFDFVILFSITSAFFRW